MKTRIITAIIGIIFCVLLMIFGEMFPIIIVIAAALVNTIMCSEFLTAKSLQKNPPVLILTLLFAVAMPLVACTAYWYIPLFIYSMLMFFMLVFLRQSVTVGDITFAYAGSVVISLAMSTISRLVFSSGGWHSFYLVMALIGPWFADSAAYFTGSFIGKKKLCPNISPNKTVEGAIGGMLGAVAGMMLAGLVFQFIVYRNMSVNYLALLVIGIYCSVVSILGDLVFSVIKRDCNIKDYGSIMPGHGGLLDRFDSVIFCAPFVYFISQSWGLITV
ncbi:MAG: phosphatidate cytidylyltransferase [Clostridia bacterium]|nr:phosphatidate cytidylyltransferase [Clostridia bacterium]